MAYYHILIEARVNLGNNDEARDITLFDIDDLQAIVPTIIRPYLMKGELKVEDEFFDFEDITLFAIKQTLSPIDFLVEQEQKELPSHTEITITPFEIFNERDLCQDVTQVVMDLLED